MNNEYQQSFTKTVQRIHDICKTHAIPTAPQLLAVSKQHSSDSIRALYSLGQHCFAESYVQEALRKQEFLHDLAIEWYFIGPIQSNKSRLIATHFNWVLSVDRLSIAEALDRHRPEHLPPLNVCIQINISGEKSKSGILPEALPGFIDHLQKHCPRLCLRGLMAIPAPSHTLAEQRIPFAKLQKLYTQLQQSIDTVDTLSMGMSGDLEAAIAEGSNQLRLGSALFGERGSASY